MFVLRRWNKRKLCIIALALFAFVTGILAWQGKFGQTEAASVQKSIAGKILRFHVIANSDLEEDQALKLMVRDRVLAYMEPLLASCENQKESEDIIRAHLSEIKQEAEDELREQGNAEEVTVSIQNRYFPVKKYGDLVFPEGDYEALCIEIGASQGKNWWCVLYPKLCFVDSLYAVVPDDSKQELQTLLTPEEYEAILQSDQKIVVKSKVLEWFQSILK